MQSLCAGLTSQSDIMRRHKSSKLSLIYQLAGYLQTLQPKIREPRRGGGNI